jgi:hypothetical protein
VTTATTWRSLPSPQWHHVSDGRLPRQLQAKHPEV